MLKQILLAAAALLILNSAEAQSLLPRCEKILREQSTRESPQLYADCMDFYFRNGEHELPPGNFEKVVTLGLLSLQREPRQLDRYSELAWLYYSRWVNWKISPSKYPASENDDQKMLQILKAGERFFPKDSLYYKMAGDVLWPMAQYHRPDFYTATLWYYEQADIKSTDWAFKVRVRLNLAHIYRRLSNFSEAKRWYRAVLEIQPSNSVAERNLNSLP